MLFVMALLLWFAFSIPAALILGRIIAAAGDRETFPAVRRTVMAGHVSRS